MENLFRKIRIGLTPRDWLLKTTLSDGVIVYGKNRAGFGGRGVYLKRDNIEPELKYLPMLLEPSGVFIDVGANVGVYSLKAAKHLGEEGVVVALEPFPEVLAVLSRNVQKNGFTNIRLRNICAGETTGTSILWMNSNKPNSFSLVQRDKKAAYLSTFTMALDELFAYEKLDRFDYLKVDAEGAEQQVLAGAQKILEKYRPIIQLETTIDDVLFSLPDYSVFRILGSPNTVSIPNESTKIELAKKLGWERAHPEVM